MKYDIIFAGVGGQGIISAASMLVAVFDSMGLNCKQNEVHGMAQRGGSVVCHVRISDKDIFSNTISKGRADIILGAEPMEALRYIEYLKFDGLVITGNKPVKNIEYPEVSKIIAEIKNKYRAVIIDTEKLVSELKSEKAINTAILGALVKELNIAGLKEAVGEYIDNKFSPKGPAVVDTNHRAFDFGYSCHSRIPE